MKPHAPRITAIALALGASLAGAAFAQTAPKAPVDVQQAEMAAARAQMDAAVKHYAELSRKYGRETVDLQFDQNVFRKPVIGVVLAPAQEGGVRIAGVTPGGAAADAGLAGGDRIIAVDGKALAGSDAGARLDAAREAIGRHAEGSKVQLRYVRGDKEAVVAVAPRIGDRMTFFNAAPMAIPDRERMEVELVAARAAAEAMRARMPEIRREVIRLGDCDEQPCAFPVLADALRWNGLNLASLDKDLGSYFGTREGVLVVSAGPDLEGLRAGEYRELRDPAMQLDVRRQRADRGRVDMGTDRDHDLPGQRPERRHAVAVERPSSRVGGAERDQQVLGDPQVQPGGQPSFRPPRTCRWRCSTLCPASGPVLVTIRYPSISRPSSEATAAVNCMSLPSSSSPSGPRALRTAGTCRVGMTRTCSGAFGSVSRNASASSERLTTVAGIVPATIPQKMQSITGSLPARSRCGRRQPPRGAWRGRAPG